MDYKGEDRVDNKSLHKVMLGPCCRRCQVPPRMMTEALKLVLKFLRTSRKVR